MEEDVNTLLGNKSEAVTPSGTNITQDIIGDEENNESICFYNNNPDETVTLNAGTAETCEKDSNLKKRKLRIESGQLKCRLPTCNNEEVDMLICSVCRGKFHYRCTKLPPYQIALFNSQGYRKFICKGCVNIPKDLVEKCKYDEANQTYQKQLDEISDLKVSLSAKHKLSESLQLALDTNKHLVEEKYNLISNQKDIVSLKSDKYAPGDECRKLLAEKEKELDRCGLEINTMKQNAPHSCKLSEIKEMISQKDHALLGQLKAIEEVSIDVQRLAKDKEILTRKFETEATLRCGLEKIYEDQIHITSKTELAFNLKDELLHAKDETIRSLKATLSYHKNCQPDLNESVPNNEQTAGLLDNANIGVKEVKEVKESSLHYMLQMVRF